MATAQADAYVPNLPDTKIKVRDVFGIDSDLEVPAFSKPSDHVPARDGAYRFDRETTLAILAGFVVNVTGLRVPGAVEDALLLIIAAILPPGFFILLGIMLLTPWVSFVGVVRAEFLRARNFEYVRAAKALGVSDRVIMFRHILPNAMVATLTLLPFVVTGAIAGLASLDFLGYGLPSSAPSLGELTLQAKQNLQAPWLGFSAFFTFALMLSLLVFIFEGVRDAFDPRKTFACSRFWPCATCA